MSNYFGELNLLEVYYDKFVVVGITELVEAHFFNTLEQKSIGYAKKNLLLDVINEYILSDEIIENTSLFDPTAGTGILIYQLLERQLKRKSYTNPVESIFLKPKDLNVKISLQDAFPNSIYVAYFLSILKEIPVAKFSIRDSLESSPLDSEGVDWVIAELPFGQKIDRSILQKTNVKFLETVNSKVSSEALFIHSSINCLSEKGRAILVVSESFLGANYNKNFRKQLVEEDLIDTVFEIPSSKKLLGHSSQFFLYLRKGKEVKDYQKIKFNKIGFSTEKKKDKVLKIVKRKTVLLPKLASSNYNLVPKRYLNEVAKTLKNLKEKEALIKFKDIATFLKFPACPRDEIYPYLSINQIKGQEGEIVASNLDIPNQPKSGKLVDKNVLIISEFEHLLRPILFRYENQPICVANNLFIVELNKDKVLPKYIVKELQKDYIKQQVAMYSSGGAIQRISKTDLGSIQIVIPIIEEQERSLFKYTKIEDKNIGFVAEDTESYYRTSESSVLSGVKHSMAQLYGAVSTEVLNIKYFLDRKIKNEEPLKWDNNISLNQRTNRTLKQVFDNVGNLLSEMEHSFDTIQRIVNFKNKQLHKEEVNIVDFFTKEAKSFPLDNKKLAISTVWNSALPKDFYLIEIDKNQFKEVIRNFIENTIKHGLSNQPLGLQEQIYFHIAPNLTTDELVIEMHNTGAPFPEGFTFEDYISPGVTSNKQKGTGLGGYFIDQVIKNHSGRFEWMTISEEQKKANGGDYRTYDENIGIHFKITLPLNLSK